MTIKTSLRALLLAAVALAASCASAMNYTSETLNYKIVYHWGIIWKHAASATLSINRTSQGYESMLVGRTVSWANSIYPVRDTLRCTMNTDFTPIRYVKIAHEKKHYGKDIVDFTHSPNLTSAQCTVIRKNKPTRHISLSTQGKAYDMLSVFYMLRALDYNELQRNKVYTTNIFSGKRKELLTIRLKSIETITLRNNMRRQAYHITFKFTQDGKKKSSDDINVWLSADQHRIPLMLVGKLPVGEVKCYYEG